MKKLFTCLTAGVILWLAGCQFQPTLVIAPLASCAAQPADAPADLSLTTCTYQAVGDNQPAIAAILAGSTVLQLTIGDVRLAPVITSTVTAPLLPGSTQKSASTPKPQPAILSTLRAEPEDEAVQPANLLAVYTTTLTLPTYPIWDYLIEQVDPVYRIPVYYFNRPVYESANPAATSQDYQAVVLENNYLRLTFLPQLGGRLYSAVIKATGQEIFYHNPVVKPSRYGVLQPYEANWWLATGGMEWAYPTQEHGYRFGVPWQYQVDQSAIRATITLSDTAPGRVGAEVSVTLPVDSPVFTISPKLVNLSDQPAPAQFWLNAALTLGAHTVSPQTRFVWPVERVTVHSRGAEGWNMPDAGQESPWPLVGQTDLRDYSQWANYLGAFAPHLAAPFMGAYNPDTDLAVARLVEPSQIPGSKLFAFGPNFSDRSYTDDDSQYFEIWGGANTNFGVEADVIVPPDGALTWQESWWPLVRLGGLTWATPQAALFAATKGDSLHLSLLLSHPGQGTIKILAGETAILTKPFTATPDTPWQWTLPAPGQPIHIRVDNQNGEILLDYTCEEC
jgi:hypothetical protein